MKGTKVRKAASPANEPDFYTVPFMPPSDQNHMYGGKGGRGMGSRTDFFAPQLVRMPKHVSSVLEGGSGHPQIAVPFQETAQPSSCSDIALNCNDTATNLTLQVKQRSSPLRIQGVVKSVLKAASNASKRMTIAHDRDIEIMCQDEDSLLAREKDHQAPVPPSISNLAFGGTAAEQRFLRLPATRNMSEKTKMSPPRQMMRIGSNHISSIIANSPDHTRLVENDKACDASCIAAMAHDPYRLRIQNPMKVGQEKNTDDDIIFGYPQQTSNPANPGPQPVSCDIWQVPRTSFTPRRSDTPELLYATWSSNLWSMLDEDSEKRDALLLQCPVVTDQSNTQEKDYLPSEELPADIELEEIIAFHIASMNRA